MTAHTLLELGGFEAERGGTEVAGELLREALALFLTLEVPLFAARAEAALSGLAGGATREAQRAGETRFEREGALWAVTFAGRRARVEHRKGMSDLALLLAQPGREFHALALMAPELGVA